jgi:hypothetical protein
VIKFYPSVDHSTGYSEWRLYYRQPSILRPSYACVFFFLARCAFLFRPMGMC